MSVPLLIARRLNTRAALKNVRNISTTAAVNAGYWNKDWRPADEPPTTEEGKRAAAKKYGMIPEDYETYPNDGTGYGDYPKLPMISAEHRDPHALYDFPEMKRNYGEPMHVDSDMIGEDRWNVNQRFIIPIHQMLLWFLGVMGANALLFWGGQYIRLAPVRVMPRHMANDGITHYTFELEDVE